MGGSEGAGGLDCELLVLLLCVIFSFHSNETLSFFFLEYAYQENSELCVWCCERPGDVFQWEGGLGGGARGSTSHFPIFDAVESDGGLRRLTVRQGSVIYSPPDWLAGFG